MGGMSTRRFHVTFVCTGNICRSPMGHVILEQMLADEGLADRVRVTSSGTGDWHVGDPADPRTVDALAAHGYDGTAHRARAFDPTEFADLDLVLALDRGHVRELRRLAPNDEDRAKIRLVREFDPDAVAGGHLETADPYYGDPEHFDRCFRDVEAACRGVLVHVRSEID